MDLGIGQKNAIFYYMAIIEMVIFFFNNVSTWQNLVSKPITVFMF